MRNIKLIIEYDGSAYHGWQKQCNAHHTIQQILEDKIEIITREKPKLHSSGRTDAGVHAINQVANFRTTSLIPPPKLMLGINSLLPSDITIKSVEDVDPEFHARYSARSKVYLYRILNRRARAGLYRKYCWHVHNPLDLDVMVEAASYLQGRHDFSSFCAANSDTEGTEREVLDTCLQRLEGDFVHFTIEATGFLKYMVRNIIGTLVHVGIGKLTPADFKAILEAKNRTLAGPTAPPQGLFLKQVNY